jgi:hypothetical protein
MAMAPGEWLDLERELRDVLAEGVEIGGTIEEADIHGCVDGVAIELEIELSDLEADEQADAYLVLCDLLATRHDQGADQVLGCLVFVTEPDPQALVTGLGRMTHHPGVFTPIVPLSRSQATLLAAACTAGAAFLDDAASLIAVAAGHEPLTRAVAQTLLDELDDLINRRTSTTS